CGTVVMGNHEVDDDKIVKPLKKLVRIATTEDVERAEKNAVKEKEAFEVCVKKIEEHKLEMKLVNVEFSFDGSKATFYFTSDDRVDFRALVKDLASVYRTRIELRQIGVRDESKMVGGLGICGLPFCCNTFLKDFAPVTIKMAKEQGLSLNPVKISGTCSRLMCCLKYEQDAYEHLHKITPKVGACVETPMGRGTVVEANLLTGKVKVMLDRYQDGLPEVFNRNELKPSSKACAVPRPYPEEDDDDYYEQTDF
ncbi:MAG TPA: regulatory iron-sulfur-containing complex subunit RicT, partial [Clostridiales bacterium]|nr:regulatory iron-sulfur-containing complex subunit RicT [Clostridiales bacterium]